MGAVAYVVYVAWIASVTTDAVLQSAVPMGRLPIVPVFVVEMRSPIAPVFVAATQLRIARAFAMAMHG